MSCDITITDSSGIELIEIGTQGPSGPPGSGGAWSQTEPIGGYDPGDVVTRAKAGITYLWISVQGSNLNHDPATDDGTYWSPADVPQVRGIQADISEASPDAVEGLLSWSAVDKTWQIDPEISGVRLQIGRELWVRVTNKTGGQLDNGVCCYINGAQGNRPTVAKAKADSHDTDNVLGLMTHDLADNGTGYMTTFGLVRDIDTTGGGEGWAAGNQLYLSAATAGGLTKTAPASPNHGVCVAVVLVAHAENGILFVSTKHDPAQFLLHTGGTLTRPTQTGGTETVTDLASAATMTLDMDLGHHHLMDTQDENTTLALSNAGSGKRATATLIQGAGGGFTIDVPGGWKPFITPTPTTTAGEANVIEVWRVGTVVYYVLKAQA